MSNKTIFIQGTAEVTVPATESISISNYGGGIAKIFYLIVTSNFPPAYQFQQAIENEGIILGPFAVATKVKIEALNSTVVYDIGASPSGGIGDAETLGGQPGSYYLDADNINSGTISDARLPGTISSDTTGNAATATDSDTLDGVQGSDYARISQINTFTANQSITASAPLLLITDTYDNHYTKFSRWNGNNYTQFYGNWYLQGEEGSYAGTLYTNEGDGNAHKFWHDGNDGSGSGLDADLLDGLHSTKLSWGHSSPHTTFSDFDTFLTSGYFGVHHVAGTTNGPGHAGATQYYHIRSGIGSEYDNYSMQWAIPREMTDAYLYYRWEAAGVASGWYKMRAGYSDNSGQLNGYTIGTSGSTIPLLDGNNTWSGTNTFTTNTTDFQALLQSRNNLLVGVDGDGDSFIQFWDDTNNAYRSMGWDDTNHYWFMEDSGGTNRQVWTAAENASVGAGSGVTGSFTTSDAKTVTVTNGIITSIV